MEAALRYSTFNGGAWRRRTGQKSGLVVQLIFSGEMIQELMIIKGNVHEPVAYKDG
jgi:hypothetical protein